MKSRLAKNEALATEPKVAEYLQIMDERITQCNKIIGDLISFTRISSPNYTVVILSNVLESTLSGIDIPGGITVVDNYGQGSMEVRVDPLQLLKVFTNLIVNAYEATLEGGELTVVVTSKESSVEEAIEDTGPGMSPEGLEVIFEPLYTTKIQGTGLGLAVCQQVITKHNDRLEVHSKVGVAATFTVTLSLFSESQ